MDKYLKQFVTKLFHTESRLLSPAIYASEFYINRGTYRVVTDTAAILNYLDLRSIMGCPGGGGVGRAWARSDVLAPVFTRAFRANFSLSSPRKRLQWEKKIVVPCLDVIMITFLPTNNHWSSHFAQKAYVNTERVPPGHPIILLKYNKFNMAAVSVKRSIRWLFLHR